MSSITPLTGFRSGFAFSPDFSGEKSGLTRESLAQAETAEFEGVPLRVVTADYLAVVALSVGRAKDSTRILSLLEANAVTRSRSPSWRPSTG